MTNTKDLCEQIARMMAKSSHYHFEDGVITPIHDEIDSMIDMGVCGISQLYAAAMSCDRHVDCRCVIIRQLGEADDSETQEFRRHLLEAALFHSNFLIRDSAGLALASMDDPKSIPAIQAAIEFEPLDTLKGDQRLVLTQLEQTANA